MADERRESTLISLSDEPITLAERSMDLRGRDVLDREGEDIGRVDDLLVDQDERRVRFLKVRAGDVLGLGGRTFLIPVDAITRIAEGEVQVDQTREHVGGGPAYDPEIVTKGRPGHEGYEQVYRHYGYAPFWMAGYAYPAFSPLHPSRPELTRDGEPVDYQPRD